MFELNLTALGITLVVLGLAFFGLIPLLLRLAPRISDANAAQQPAVGALALPESDAAVILVSPGGRVLHLNRRAREWFNLDAHEYPNLERLARAARPSDAFLDLCAGAGEAHFTLHRSLVEGNAYAFPHQGEHAVLVTLMRPQALGADEGSTELTGKTWTLLAEIARKMSASLDLDTTITTILENIDQLVQSDFSEITLWDPQTGQLTPYRYTSSVAEGSQVKKSRENYYASEGYSGYLITEREPLLIDDVEGYEADKPHTVRKKYPFKSYLGVPLIVGGEQIGTLELAAQRTHAFSNEDLRLVQMISGQAGVALQNAIVHYQEQKRVAEISGLAELTQVSKALGDQQQLFENLTRSIAELLNVNIAGFIVYDETRRELIAQSPFVGMPDEFVALYRSRLDVGSAGEAAWNKAEMILTSDASSNETLNHLGLAQFAPAVAITETALVPLTAGGPPLGYLQVANKRDSTPLDADDLRLLRVIGGQCAPILQNASLIQDARRRTQRAETLRRVASLAGAEITLDEILQFSLLELTRFFQAGHAGLYLVHEDAGELRLHQASMVGLSETESERLSRIALSDERYASAVTSTGMPLLFDDIFESTELPAFYQPLREHLPTARAAMIAPLPVRERGLGEIVITSREPGQFDHHDLQTLGTAADQLATALVRSKLLNQTDETLQRRVEQLTSLSRVSRELNTTLNLQALLQRVYDEALRGTHADGGSIILFNPAKSRNRARDVLLQLGTVHADGLSALEEKVIARGTPMLITDYSKEKDAPPAESARSGLLVPVAYQNEIAGLIHLYARQPGYFDPLALEITQALAIQAAIALGNAQRYQEQLAQADQLNRRVSALKGLLESKAEAGADQPLTQSLARIAEAIRIAGLFDVVCIYKYDPNYETIKLSSAAGLPEAIFEDHKEVMFPWSHIEAVEAQGIQHGSLYFVPTGALKENAPLVPGAIAQQSDTTEESEAWQAGDQIIVPLYSNAGAPLGALALNTPLNGERPDELTVESLGFFGAEISMLLESEQQLHEVRTKAESIQREIAQAEGAGVAGQNGAGSLSVFLHKDLEQTIAIQQLYERARNIRVGLDIAEIVNRQPDRDAVLGALGHQLLTQMNLDAAIIAERSSGGPRLVHQMGALPENANPEALLGQRNPLHHTLQTGETLLVADIELESEWGQTTLLRNLDGRGFISLPIQSGGQVDAAILAISHTPLPPFNEEDQQVFELIGSQVAIALQNLSLLTETRRRLREVNLLLDFSRQLGTLDAATITRNLVENARRVISNAHAAMVILWDPARKLLVPQMAAGYTENQALQRVSFRSGEALPGQVFASSAPQIVDEVDFASMYNLPSEKLLLYREATGGRLPVSSMAIPIQAADQTLGVIVLDNFNTPAAFSEDDLALVESLTQQTALTLVNAQLFEETQRFNEELEQRVSERTEELQREHHLSQTLLRISTELSSSLDLDHVLNRSLAILNERLGAEQASILITRPDEEFLVYRAGTGITESPPMGGRVSSFRIGEGLAGWVILHKKPMVIPELAKDGRWDQHQGDNTDRYNSAIVVPLSVGEDTIGALLLYHTKRARFSEDMLNAVQAAANQFAVSINNGELFRLIRDQASDLGTMLRSQQVETSRSTAMLEGVADGVLVTDANNVITLFNDAAVKTLELPRNQVVGRTLDHFMGLFGREGESWIATIRRWAEHKVTREVSEVYSEQIVLEDGRVVSVHLAPVSDQQEFLGTVSIFRDITHQVEVDRLKSEFVATVSHELRTPMTPIKGYVEFLMMGGAGDLTDQQTEFMSIIKSNIDRLSVLVNDLLDVSRIEAGKVGLNLQPVDIREATEEILLVFRQKAEEEERPMAFELDAGQGISNVYGDPERVRQIIANLVDNAYRYSEPGGRVDVRVREVDDHIQVDVKDYGIGIYPDEHERIFERFYRGENPLVFASAGTGLGLAIVRELIEMHTGRIWLSSAGVPGEGSMFSFVLPVYNPEKELKPTRLEGTTHG